MDATRTAVITGGRDYTPTLAEMEECASVMRERGIEVVVHGAARGVDSTVGSWLMRGQGFEVAEMPADWERHGKAAGPIRNREMLSRQGVRLLVAFKGGRGTWNCIQTAKRLGIDVWVIGEGIWSHATADTPEQRSTATTPPGGR